METVALRLEINFAAGFTWFPGHDDRTPLLMVPTPCNPAVTISPNALNCGGGAGISVSGPAECANLCNRLSGCGCTSFTHDARNQATGFCCYLKNGTGTPGPQLMVLDERFDAYLSNK